MKTIPEPADYEQRVQAYQAEGMTRGDAQAIVDAEEMQKPSRIRFNGKRCKGLSESSAVIECAKRAKARPDYDWRVAVDQSNRFTDSWPNHPIARYEVVGTRKGEA